MDYMLRDYHPEIDRDIVFIPVGINYDRVIEDKSLTRRLDPDAAKRSGWFVIKTSFKFFFKTMMMKRKARWRRFGYASVNFGKPISAHQYCNQESIDFSQLDQDARFKCIENLSKNLMHEISQVIPILPVALMAEIILQNRQEWKSELELKTAAVTRIKQLRELGAPIDISASACEHVLTSAIDMLTGRGFVKLKDGLYKADHQSKVILDYYANSIAHWLQCSSD